MPHHCRGLDRICASDVRHYGGMEGVCKGSAPTPDNDGGGSTSPPPPPPSSFCAHRLAPINRAHHVLHRQPFDVHASGKGVPHQQWTTTSGRCTASFAGGLLPKLGPHPTMSLSADPDCGVSMAEFAYCLLPNLLSCLRLFDIAFSSLLPPPRIAHSRFCRIRAWTSTSPTLIGRMRPIVFVLFQSCYFLCCHCNVRCKRNQFGRLLVYTALF